jgi:hypothetical protein
VAADQRTRGGCRTYGAWLCSGLFPALTRWANFCRAYGAEETRSQKSRRDAGATNCNGKRRCGGRGRISGRGDGVAPTALGSLRDYSQRLRAGLTSAAPMALRKREVKRAGGTPALRTPSIRPGPLPSRQGKPRLRKATAEARCRGEGRGATFKPSSDEQSQKSRRDADATKAEHSPGVRDAAARRGRADPDCGNA